MRIHLKERLYTAADYPYYKNIIGLPANSEHDISAGTYKFAFNIDAENDCQIGDMIEITKFDIVEEFPEI